MKKPAFVLLSLLFCAAAEFFSACGGGGSTVITPPAPSCPSGAVVVSPTTIVVGGTSIASAPAGWTGGSFTSSPSGVATISGSTVTGASAGSATISGSGWTASNGATGCSLTGALLTITLPVAISITSPDPLPTAVGSGGTIQFEATVTGSDNVKVTWSVTPPTAGTITAGLFTAAVTATNVTATIIATAEADTSKTASASINVTGASTIVSSSPWGVYCDGICQRLQVTLNGYGFMLDYIASAPNINYQGTTLVSSDQSIITTGLDDQWTSDGPYVIWDCRAQAVNCSNPAAFLDFGSETTAVIDTAPKSTEPSEIITIDRAAGTIWKNKPDCTPDGSLVVFNNGTPDNGIDGVIGIAFDEFGANGAGMVWTDLGGSINGRTTDGTLVGIAYDFNFTGTTYTGGIAAKNNIVCVAEYTVGLVACFTAKSALPNSTGNAAFYRVAAGMEPYAIAMYSDGTQTLLAVLDREGTTLFVYSLTVDPTDTVITFTEVGSTPLAFTPVDQLRPGNEAVGVAGGWSVRWLGPGLVAVKAQVLATEPNAPPTDELFYVNTQSFAASPAIELPPYSFRMLAEPSGNAVDVESASPVAGNPAEAQLTISRVPTASGAKPVTIFSKTIDLSATPSGTDPQIGVGFTLKPDGSAFYTTLRDQCGIAIPQPVAQ